MIDYTPEDILSHLRQTVTKGKYGVDYTIKRRDKNDELREKYLIDDCKIKDILLSLTADNYICSEDSDQEDFPDDIVHKFIKNVHLIRRYSDSIIPENVKLYIKFTWPKQTNKILLIISFHEENKT